MHIDKVWFYPRFYEGIFCLMEYIHCNNKVLTFTVNNITTMAAIEKKETTTIRVSSFAIGNCVSVGKELGHPFTFNSVVDLAMQLVTKEQIIEHLKNKK